MPLVAGGAGGTLRWRTSRRVPPERNLAPVQISSSRAAMVCEFRMDAWWILQGNLRWWRKIRFVHLARLVHQDGGERCPVAESEAGRPEGTGVMRQGFKMREGGCWKGRFLKIFLNRRLTFSIQLGLLCLERELVVVVVQMSLDTLMRNFS